MKKLIFILPFVLCLSCARMASSNKADYINARRIELSPAALKGDAQAQYELGNSYCCGNGGFFNTEEAVKWWCKAARQGHRKAKRKLERHDRGCAASVPLDAD